jgi:hypothetical protein
MTQALYAHMNNKTIKKNKDKYKKKKKENHLGLQESDSRLNLCCAIPTDGAGLWGTPMDLQKGSCSVH